MYRSHCVGCDLVQSTRQLSIRALLAGLLRWNYEIGEKLRTADNRVTINASVYYEDWAGAQQTNALSSCGYVYQVNAGNAHVDGGELEVQAIVVRDLVVSANASYTHAALISATLIDSGFNPGTPIQDAPRWTSSASIAYRHSLTDRLAFTARADNTYVGSRTDETYSTNILPSYDLTNLRTGVEGARWSAVLFVNNISDQRALLSTVTEDAANNATFNRIAVS
jgi:iron complex outermembrane receptor protein